MKIQATDSHTLISVLAYKVHTHTTHMNHTFSLSHKQQNIFKDKLVHQPSYETLNLQSDLAARCSVCSDDNNDKDRMGINDQTKVGLT